MYKKRVVCYVDGFNMYHGLKTLQRDHLKWLNLASLIAFFVRDRTEVLTDIFYFTAYATWKPDSFTRHRAYIAALETTFVVPVLANFKAKQAYCNRCNNQWTEHEEKETDVHIATNLIRGVFENRFDKAILISADSDLVPAVSAFVDITTTKELLILTPPNRGSADLKKIAKAHSKIKYQKIKSKYLEHHLFPEKIQTQRGILIRPVEYDPPSRTP